MNKTPIAEIRLTPGEVGYYDDYSRIYLSVACPKATIYAGMNCSQIKRSIKSGRLQLVSGSFDVAPKAVEVKEESKSKVAVEEVKPEAKEEVLVVAEPKAVVEQPTAEVVIASVEETSVVEEAPKKAKTARKRASKAEQTEEAK